MRATLICVGLALAAAPATAGQPTSPQADRVVVRKADRRLVLLREGDVLRTYRVALGRNPERPKVAEGDGRTPEGRYVLDWRNPDSRFHRSIHISYPAPRDVERAQRLGVDPGGAIMIHGLPGELALIGRHHAPLDWTEGCIAVTNREMDEIWALVPDGTPIWILP